MARRKKKNIFVRFFEGIIPQQEDSAEDRKHKINILSLLGMLVLMMTVASFTFLVSLRGGEESTVPDLEGEELVTAITLLQERGLIPIVQAKYSDDYLQNQIISHNPKAGLLVKEGRRINLVVSKGSIITEVKDYIGQSFGDVRIELQNYSAAPGLRQMLRLKEPVVYIYNEAAPGTIIEQKPVAGTKVSKLTELTLVVSRGPEGSFISIDDYMGMDFQEALVSLSEKNLSFVFKHREATRNEVPGTIVSQNPVADSMVKPTEVVELLMAEPRVEREHTFSTFSFSRDEPYSFPVDLELSAIDEEGQSTVLFFTRYRSGEVNIPYYQKDGNLLVLKINESKIKQVVVGSEN